MTSPPTTSADLTPVKDSGAPTSKGGLIVDVEDRNGGDTVGGGGLGGGHEVVAEKAKGEGKVGIVSPEDAAEKTPEHGMNGTKHNGDAHDKKKV